TDNGKLIINNLDDFIREFSGITSIENKLKKLFNIEHIRVVTGDSDKDLFVKDELGRAAVSFLKKMAKEKQIIAVTGGTPEASVAYANVPRTQSNSLFLTAHRRVSRPVEHQANTI